MPEDIATGAIDGTEETTSLNDDAPTGGDTPATDETAAASDTEEQPGGEADDEGESEDEAPADDDGQSLVESLKKSLRATTAERKRLLEENRKLREQMESTSALREPPAPRDEDVPDEIDEEAMASRGFRKVSRLQDEVLEGLWYDPTDGTVCIGDPTQPADWVKEDVARAVVAYRKAQQQEIEVARQRLEMEREEALRNIAEHYDKAARQLRERLLPTVTDDKTKTIVDSMVLAETARRLGAEGIGQEQLLEMQPEVLDRASDILYQVVRDVRTLLAEVSRAENRTLADAARTAPVPAAGGSEGVNRAKSTADMTASEHRDYLLQEFKRFRRKG